MSELAKEQNRSEPVGLQAARKKVASEAQYFSTFPLSSQEFARFQALIYRESGIWLSSAKTALLAGRLSKRLRFNNLQSFSEYYRLVVCSPEERVHMLDAISTNETHFFREPKHFELLKNAILPQLRQNILHGSRERKIQVLSAGCSTGQEPYSLAMLLLDSFPPQSGWKVEITAGDISTRVIGIASRGVWGAEKVSEIPVGYRKRFLLRGIGDQAGKIKATQELRSVIRFLRVNLNENVYPFCGPFDLIFCRNVLIYFDKQGREAVIRRLASLLSAQGYFFVGHAESLHGLGDVLTAFVPTVYKRGANGA